MENIKVAQLEPVFDAPLHPDFRELMDYAEKNYHDDDAYIIKKKNTGKNPEYTHITYHALKDHLNWFGTALLNRGFRGSRVAVIAENCYEWMLVYYAVPCGLGITVPLDKGLPYDEALQSLQRSKADIIVFDKKHQELIENLKNDDTELRYFFTTEVVDGYESVWDLIEEGKAACAAGDHAYWNLPIDPDDTALILFTSGTSGMAKAVMLSQKNVLTNVYFMQRTQDIRHHDINMAFLPYHHTFGCDTQVMMYACGVTTVFCDGLRYIQKNMIEYGVTIFIGVPLLVEAIYKRVMRGIEKQGKMKTFSRAVKLSDFLMKLHIDRRRKMFREVIDQLGGNLRFVFSGASALDPEVVRGFEAMGICVVQGYGMTESSPVIATEGAHTRRPGSIGKALYGVEVELKDPNEEGIGEIICRSPSVMKGYYEDPEDTAKTIVDGWLHTGDLAKVDKDGFLFITGRAKNVIVMKNGKNVYPEEMESLIGDLPYVRENIVIGVKKREDDPRSELALCAKIVYDPQQMAEEYGAGDQKAIEKVIWKDLEKINQELPKYKRITRLIITDKEMVKTTTGKVKRFEESASC